MSKLIGFIVLLTVLSCQSSQIETYAVLSHTRLNDNSGIDSTVSQANLKKYDLLLLGGDLANLSSLDDSILSYLDAKFDLSNENTLWALGNHDYTNIDLLKSYTKKENYYAHYQSKTVFIVLDTQQDSSKIIGEQLNFYNALMDTITEAKNLVLLTHKLIWMRDHPELDKKINEISNGNRGKCDYCVQENNFYEAIYPKLVEFKNQSNGQVYCIAGDVGFKTSKFEYQTKEGIQFLASGIKANNEGNYFLKIENKIELEKLSYQFISLKEI